MNYRDYQRKKNKIINPEFKKSLKLNKNMKFYLENMEFFQITSKIKIIKIQTVLNGQSNNLSSNNLEIF